MKKLIIILLLHFPVLFSGLLWAQQADTGSIRILQQRSSDLIKSGDLVNARLTVDEALSDANRLGNVNVLKSTYRIAVELDSVSEDFVSALANYKRFLFYSDSLVREADSKKTISLEMQRDFDIKEAARLRTQKEKDDKEEKQRRKQMIIISAFLIGFLLVLFLAYLIFRNLQANRKKNRIIEEQKAIVEEKQKEILDSIRYAKRIQQAQLPTEKYIRSKLEALSK